MDLSKFSDADLDALEKGDVKALSDAGLDELERQQKANQPSMLQKAAGGVARLIMKGGPGGVIGDEVKAGYAGLGDVAAGNGLDTAAANVHRVENEVTPTTTASNVGSAIGGEFSPIQIALQGGFEAAADAIAPWVSGFLKKWGEKAALNAIGMITSIGRKFGLENLDGLAQFLLKPITFGGKTYEPIVTWNSSTSDMLEKAQTLADDAGKMLGIVAKKVDDSVPASSDVLGGSTAPMFDKVDLPALKDQVAALRDQFKSLLPNLGKPVIEKYQAALDDIENLIAKALTDETPAVFSDLAAARTALGSLAFEHSSKMESTKALQDVYWKMADILSKAADRTSVGPEWADANLIYHRAMAVVAALSGKSLKFSVKDIFAPGAGGFIGSIVGGLPGLVAGSVAGAATQAYGHQAIAQALEKGAPLVAGAVKVGVRGIPFVGEPVANALTNAITGN